MTCTFPFPEWSDSEVNEERWETTIKANKGDTTKNNVPLETQTPYFLDDQAVPMPSSLNVHEWKRLTDIYQNADFIIMQGTVDFAGLKEGSKNVMHSEFMRSFISAIGILEYISAANPWPVESTTPNYTPNTGKESWKPWHHIYSICKAGKGTHLPKFNRSGKYIVRLHWMGSWRKIYVDDHLPVDTENNILLPNFGFPEAPAEPSKSKEASGDTKNKKVKKEKDTKVQQPPLKTLVEIWQFILCKALLKIACLSWNDTSELVDFCPISCLTGWVCQKLDTLGMSPSDIWEVCESFAPKYEWDDKPGKPSTNKENASEKQKKSSKGSKSSKDTKKSKAGVKVPDETLPYAIVATCFDMRKLTLQDIPATWSCDVLIEQVRDVPLVKPQPRPEFARWKKFRWITWALRKGIISPDDDVNVQCLKFFSSLNKCLEGDDMPKTQSPKKGTSEKSKKSPKSSQASSKKTQIKVTPQIDRSIWVDFNKIQYAITTMYVFFKPSQFNTKIKLSDVTQKNEDRNKSTKKDKKTDVQEIYYPSELRESHNEPMYIFCDSLDHKFVVLNLSQTGNVGRLLKKPEDTAENFCYLTVETYDWQTNQRGGDDVLFLNTRATKTTVVYFKPGRFLSKLWVKSDNCFVVMVLSETPVIVGNHQTLIRAMTSESLSLMKLSHEVSDNFGKLVQSFGTPSYLESLRNFYGTYKSGFPTPPNNTYEIHRIFMGEVLAKISADGDVFKFALKVLFLDPSLTTCKSRETDGYRDEYEDDPKKIERAAVKIQSVMKCIFVRKLLALHDPNNVKHAAVYENLRKIYGQIFSLQNRDTCTALIRNTFCQLARANYTQKNMIVDDLRSVIAVQSFAGSVSSDASAWVLLTRKKFSCTSVEPIKIGVHVYCSLRKYAARVFDNDTGKEFLRFTNKVGVCACKKNSKGYTILCYGWAEEADVITWDLSVIWQKEETPQVSIPEQVTYETSLVDCYKPNVNNQICKCILDVNRNTTATFRFATSYNTAKIRLFCMNEYRLILNEIVGVGDVVLPLTYLEVTPPNFDAQNSSVRTRSAQKQHRSKTSLKSSSRVSSTISLVTAHKKFYVEAFVLEDSWPLTRKEWMVVAEERKKCLLYPEELGDRLIFDYLKSLPAHKNNVPNPHWRLQIIFDVNDALTLARDDRREVEIRNIKQEWYKASPNRAETSREIREKYLQTHQLDCANSEPDEIFKSKLDSAVSYLLPKPMGKLGLTAKASPSAKNDARLLKSNANFPVDLPEDVALLNSFDDEMASERLIKWNPVVQALSPFDADSFIKNGEVSIDDRLLLTEKWKQLEENNRTEACERYFKELNKYRDNMDKVLCDQIENFVILRRWQDENKAKSTRNIKSAYRLRDNFIESLIQKEETRDAVKKNKKGSKKITNV